MAARPSTQLINLIRDAARKKGWNTSTLAQHAGIDRSRLKQVLAGREPMTVDELMQLSEAMELTPADVGVVGLTADTEPPEEEPLPGPGVTRLAAASEPEPEEPAPFPDPFGIHAEQIIQLGFALGVNIYFTADTSLLGSSGIPRVVLDRFKAAMPIRLDVEYHRHYAPEYFPEGLQVRLSFDAVYTCLFPWAAIQQITLFPFAPEPQPEPEPEPEPETEPRKGGFLRLVE